MKIATVPSAKHFLSLYFLMLYIFIRVSNKISNTYVDNRQQGKTTEKFNTIFNMQIFNNNNYKYNKKKPI